MPDENDSKQPAEQPRHAEAPPRPPRSIWMVSYIKRKLDERKTKYKAETAEQKHSRRTATATWWIAVFTIVLALVSTGTFYLLFKGGKDTRDLITATQDLATAANGQFEAMQELARAASGQAGSMRVFADRMKDQADRTKTIADQAIVSADAAKSAAGTSEKAMTVGNRPWVKITHRIVQPLTFGFIGAAGPAATMNVEDTIENVGTTIALNVLAWEDVIPEDYETPPRGGGALPTTKSAKARQRDWCDANRNSEQSRRIGNILFPHSPMVQVSGMGPLMSKVNEALIHSPIKGKVSFVMVGCVAYRSSFEDPTGPNHQTRFMYRLGIPQSFGGWLPFVQPEGTAINLRLIEGFDTFTAD